MFVLFPVSGHVLTKQLVSHLFEVDLNQLNDLLYCFLTHFEPIHDAVLLTSKDTYTALLYKILRNFE